MASRKAMNYLTLRQSSAIGEYLKTHGIFIKDIANYFKIDPGNFSRFLTGDRPMPYHVPEKMFDYLGYPKELNFLSHYPLIGNEDWQPKINLTKILGYKGSDLEDIMRRIEKIYHAVPSDCKDDLMGDLDRVVEFYSNLTSGQ